MDWLSSGQWMEFTVYANYNQENVDELDYNNNYSEESFYVEAGQTLDVAPIPLTINTVPPSDLSWQIIDGLYAVYPVSNVRFILSGYTRGYTIADTLNFAEEGSGCRPAFSSILNALSTVRSGDNYSGYVRYYGMVNPSVTQAGPVGGCGRRPGYVSGGIVTLTDLVSSKTIAAEEIGHNHGRQHSSAHRDAGDPDTNSPFYYDGVLEEGTMGTDVRLARLYPRATSFDFMSYNDTCCRWASIYTYEALARAINSVAFNPAGSLRQAAPIKQTMDIPILIGAGSISPEGVTIPRPFFTTTRVSPAWDDLPLGPYWMELQDSSGNVLFSRNFGVPGVDNAVPGDTGDFDFVVPTTDNVAAVVFKYMDTEIGRVTASPNAPQVSLLTPNGGEQWGASEEQTITWTGSDPDGDSLTYRLEYSPDGGNSWRLLALDTQETSLTVNTTDLPGGNAVMIRLLASDGLNTSEDFPDGLLTVAAKPPQLYIGNPQDETTLPDGWPVILHAYGTDLEDGPLPPETSFDWASDRDGQMGTGEWLIASSQNMSLGDHVITLTGTDSDGQKSTYTTKITVTAGEPAAVAKQSLPLWLLVAGIALAAGLVAAGVTAVVLVLRRRRK